LNAADGLVLTHHAKARMYKRKISLQVVRDCLRHGVIVEGPAMGTRGNWEIKVSRRKGAMPVSVVIAINWDETKQEHLLIVTVIGE
jgi:Domain of unknown function (DUF4258)